MDTSSEEMYFLYREQQIFFNEIGKRSSNAIVQEFNSKFEELNLKYSFGNVSKLTENEWVKFPIILHYKGNNIWLKDFVTEYKNLAVELKHISEIEGLNAIHQAELLNNAMFSKNFPDEAKAICIETFRLLQDLYNTFAMARYSLLQGYQKFHSYNIVTWESGTQGQYWIRANYLNNAIVWYNSCFDILLQTYWIGKKYFLKSTNLKKQHILSDLNSLEKYETVLQDCNINSFPQSKDIEELRAFTRTQNFKNVRDKANTLKHRHGIRYSELSQKNEIAYISKDETEYSSIRTQSLITFEVVIDELKSFHKDFALLVAKTKTALAEEFKQYGISL